MIVRESDAAAAAEAIAIAAAAAVQRSHGDDERDKRPEVPPEVAIDAERFLLNPGIIDEVIADFARLGIVGETLLAIAIYLIGTSRLLVKPLRDRPGS